MEGTVILEQINKANIVAFKEKDSIVKDVISVIKGRAKLIEVEKRTTNSEMTDADIVKLLQKLIKELEEQQENYKKVNNTAEVEVLSKQIEFCKGYLPKMLSKEEIKNIIVSLEDKSTPSVMKYFKANYMATCDMKEVQEVLKSL